MNDTARTATSPEGGHGCWASARRNPRRSSSVEGMSTHAEIVTSLLSERTVVIVTLGRRSGMARTTEIWTTALFGDLYICGSPNATKPGVLHQPRDWFANLLAQPEFLLRLTRGAEVELPARAERVLDVAGRSRILSAPSTAFYRNAVSFEVALAHSPIVKVHFEAELQWLSVAIADAWEHVVAGEATAG